MEKLKRSKIGIISFLLALVPIVYVIIQTIVDLSTPIIPGINKSNYISDFIMLFMIGISFVSFVLSIIAITQKDYKKGLPISSTIMSGLILLIPILAFILDSASNFEKLKITCCLLFCKFFQEFLDSNLF